MSTYSSNNEKQNQLNLNSFNSTQFESQHTSNIPVNYLNSVNSTTQPKTLNSKQVQKTLSSSGLLTTPMDSNFNWGSLSANSSTNTSFPTSNQPGVNNGPSDLWKNLDSPSSTTTINKKISTPSGNNSDQYFQPNKDIMYNSFFDNQNIPPVVSDSNKNNDVETLSLQILNITNPPNNQKISSSQDYHSPNQFSNPSSVANAATTSSGYGLSHDRRQQHNQQTHNKWSYSTNNQFILPMTSYSDSQSTYIGHSGTPSLSQYSQSTYSNQQQQQQNQQNQQNQSQKQNQSQQKSSLYIDSKGLAGTSDLEIKLQLKQTIITKLEKEVERLTMIVKSLSQNDSTSDDKDFQIPQNHIEIYNKLSDKLQTTEDDLKNTKLRLEAVLAAIWLGPNQSATKSGRYDEEEAAHKIITKLQMLTEENDELSKMLSYGKSKEKDILIGLLRKQNEELVEKITKLELKDNESK